MSPPDDVKRMTKEEVDAVMAPYVEMMTDARTLLDNDGQWGLLPCTHKETGELIVALVLVRSNPRAGEPGQMSLVIQPVARMFSMEDVRLLLPPVDIAEVPKAAG